MTVSLKQALASNRVVRVFAVGHVFSAELVEMIGLAGGYDAVWLDQEHAGLTIQQIEQGTRAARAAGIDTFVRLTATDYATVMRPLEAGAGGIMAAQVRSAAQTEQIVQWAKFHPRGCRGINNTGVDGRYGMTPFADYAKKANAETFVAIQIEHIEAVEDVERIAAVPDVDVLFIGPADLSQSMGLLGRWDDAEMWKAIERVAQAARRHNIHWAILPANLAYARRCVELGCKMLSIGIDAWAVAKGLKATREEYAEFFG